MSATIEPALGLRRLKTFVAGQALPLWATAGFDEAAGCFHERLALSGEPVGEVPRRLMVQARQIVVYSRASLAGWSKGGEERVWRAFENARRRYRSPDGKPGWIFSVDPGGRPHDATRDLYTHAFVLYMLAWLYRLGGDASLPALADSTLEDVDLVFSRPAQPGFLSKVPGKPDLREQNPHMHLLEALLALADASKQERYLARATAIVELFDAALSDPATGTVREIFGEDWKPDRAPGENVVEPGHQMEWAWLLREWERLTGLDAGDRVGRLVAHAVTYGIDRKKALVRSQVQENGAVISGGSRVWPQTETIRALCREDPDGKLWPNLVNEVTEGLFRTHLPADLKGGWIDQVDQNGDPAVAYMPASTLYHLAGAAIDGTNALETR
ncbi:AGE family epimerase/isomerase [Bradyrhizobium sp. NP1]|uniref:AGE family epimerase/isomerase n=1 Tax=Bradyrhizobium sp. NP1 TaxID=3049772 RepID=UPI0025A62915|nr:AGE family epimerase/isomerase [Bradyrhizobium sp. NP1]WJR81415.1 AGE family epimerase/isomerase [Bradyrhizobium sp. NP1]